MVDNGRMLLDFSDVLIRPRDGTLNSRANVQLECKKKFKHSPMTWTGTPIIVSNMDTTGTFEVYAASRPYGIVTALHKFYTFKDYEKANKLFHGRPEGSGSTDRHCEQNCYKVDMH